MTIYSYSIIEIRTYDQISISFLIVENKIRYRNVQNTKYLTIT